MAKSGLSKADYFSTGHSLFALSKNVVNSTPSTNFVQEDSNRIILLDPTGTAKYAISLVRTTSEDKRAKHTHTQVQTVLQEQRKYGCCDDILYYVPLQAHARCFLLQTALFHQFFKYVSEEVFPIEQ
jgi:hypothetical protein